MKIQKFNENILTNKWKPTDKVLRVIPRPFEVLIDDIRKIEQYKTYAKDIGDWKEDHLFYGLEWYAYESGNIIWDYTLYDGNGNLIEDEHSFDEYVENIKKYNL